MGKLVELHGRLINLSMTWSTRAKAREGGEDVQAEGIAV